MKKTMIHPFRSCKLEGMVTDHVCTTGCLAPWRVLITMEVILCGGCSPQPCLRGSLGPPTNSRTVCSRNVKRGGGIRAISEFLQNAYN